MVILALEQYFCRGIHTVDAIHTSHSHHSHHHPISLQSHLFICHLNSQYLCLCLCDSH